MLKQLFFIVIISSFTIISCTERNKTVPFLVNYENTIWQETNEKYSEDLSSTEKIEWSDEIYKLFNNKSTVKQLTSFFIEKAITTNDKLFSDYLYFLLSDIYWKQTNTKMSIFYMSKISEDSFALKHEDQEIGYIMGLRIIKLKDYPLLRIKTYKMLLSKYRDFIDESLILYELSELYKSRYDIENAIIYMKDLVTLSSRSKIIDERIKIDAIKEQVDFYYSNKEWINKDLNNLIGKIKYAIDTQNITLLNKYISKTGFVVRFFNSNDDKWTIKELGIPRRWRGNIQFAQKFEDISNENEVYLETKGWAFPMLKTWYFYFKKIDYPYNETINGSWEWKGIYFGNWM